MKANELRIGNIVDRTCRRGDVYLPANYPMKVYEITSFECLLYDIKKHPSQLKTMPVEGLRDVFGIPLTEEWLLKFGFLSDGDGFLKDIKHNELFIHLNHFNEVIFQIGYKDNWSMNMSIRYVHQLQNLYFALTGEELSVNE